MEESAVAVDTLLINPGENTVESHYELLMRGREEYEGTVTVIGLAS